MSPKGLVTLHMIMLYLLRPRSPPSLSDDHFGPSFCPLSSPRMITPLGPGLAFEIWALGASSHPGRQDCLEVFALELQVTHADGASPTAGSTLVEDRPPRGSESLREVFRRRRWRMAPSWHPREYHREHPTQNTCGGFEFCLCE